MSGPANDDAHAQTQVASAETSVATQAQARGTGTATVAEEATDGAAEAPAGYTAGALLGRGGMGEVILAHHARIGRKVALKRMRAHAPSEDALARFLREGRIQARLEHPAIVPVYDLGEDADGAPFFTMKRLAGVTLLDKLADPRASRQELLRKFVDVCLAVDFAHTRGVVHRDLKPSNVMLGDFGEVYVLDWGVARVLGTDMPASRESGPIGHDVVLGDIATLDSQTQAGAVLGTPGYMPPEQLAGAEVTPAADVYALGSMLFEILAGEALHPRGTAALASTVTTPTASPAERQPERHTPPELDATCTAALAAEPTARPTARALADRVQSYLDGDRDVERRRALAGAELADARAALDTGDPARRADAVAAAGRALALDPTSKAAAELVSSLMLAPPESMPPELEAELAEVDRGLAVEASRSGALAILAFLMFVPFVAVIRITSWPLVLGFFGSVLGLAGGALVMARSGRPRVVLFMVAFQLLLVILGRSLGPWVIVPGVIALSTSALIALPQLVERPVLTIGTGLVTMFAPVVLEHFGVFGSTWSLDDNTLTSHSAMLDLHGTAALVFLGGAHVALIVVNSLLARALARSRRAAHYRAEMQAWHLRKLVPGAPRPGRA